MGQTPITFIRQVIACVSYPKFLDSSEFPQDVKQHARQILEGCGGNSVGKLYSLFLVRKKHLGAYSQSTGVDIIRKHVAEFISERDGGISSNPEDIILSGGASESIRVCEK
jgi:alanine transaminase